MAPVAAHPAAVGGLGEAFGFLALAAGRVEVAGGRAFGSVGVAASADFEVAPRWRAARRISAARSSGVRSGGIAAWVAWRWASRRARRFGDSVPPRTAEVTAVSPDEKVFEFAFAD
jgi:hypothetical protein